MILTIGHEKGGVGKSRTSIALASMAASDGVDVLLLDTDAQGSSSRWSRLRNAEGVEPAVPVLALADKPLRELLNLAARYELIIVDIGAQNYRTMKECVLVSDLVLVPCGPDQDELDTTANLFEELRTLDAKHRDGKVPAYALLTRLSTNARATDLEGAREWLTSAEVPVFDSAIRQRSAWRTIAETGRGLHELTGRSRDAKAVDEVRAVYDEVARRINEKESS